MTDSKLKACATRARVARSVSAAAALAALLSILAAGAARAQEGGKPTAASITGAWQATLPTGLRVATLTVVPDGEGFGGAFVGYDYDRKMDFQKPAEGPPPHVSARTGSMLTGAKLEGDAFTFKIYLRHPSPPPGQPAGYEVSGEMRFTGGDTGELRLSAPHKPEPMVLKLTRE
ncbi:MAG TPA: hypothetical protein VKB12_03510 [Pyrinomonadaceae bacterium]|nr:hypothetical protein [Pyrinomonadaceae bacterium]